MQKKKYLFSLVILMISLVCIFGRGTEANAAKCCYSMIGGVNQCHSGAVAGSCVENLVGSCPKCTAENEKTPEGCCDGQVVDCNYAGCLLNETEGWCCVDNSGSKAICSNIKPGQSCGKTLKERACDVINDCKTAGNSGWSCVNNNGKDKATCTDIPYKGVCSKSGVPPTESPCAVACASIGGCAKGEDESGNNNNGTGTPSTSIEFPNPITSNSVDEVLTTLLTALSGLVVTLAIIFIVLGGILYMMSAGDPGMIKRAKDCWLGAVIGLAIVIAAPTFLKQVQIILGGKLTGGGIEKALTISDIATNILNFLLSVVGVIAIISLVVAGGMYMTAYGDDTRMGTAKKMATWAIVGIVVSLVSLIAVQQVAKLITG